MLLNPTPLVLLAIADATLARQMSLDLHAAGYDAAIARDARSAGRQLAELSPSLAIVDWILDGETGISFCRQIRGAGNTIPVLLLLNSDTVEERVACLEAGVDDYFLKPYSTAAFVERLKLYLQPYDSPTEQLRFADLVLDLTTRKANRSGRPIEFTMKEFELLKYLMEHPRDVLSREQILDRVWGYEFRGESNVIEVYIRYLRLKIEQEGEKRLIHTVRGVGYVLREA